VTLGRPEAENGNEWFNLLALHQNRAKSSSSGPGSVRDVLLPACMDIVIWGHVRNQAMAHSRRAAHRADLV